MNLCLKLLGLTLLAGGVNHALHDRMVRLTWRATCQSAAEMERAEFDGDDDRVGADVCHNRGVVWTADPGTPVLLADGR